MCFACVANRLAAGLIAEGLYMHVLSDSGRALLTDSSSPSLSLSHSLPLAAQAHEENLRQSDCITVLIRQFSPNEDQCSHIID